MKVVVALMLTSTDPVPVRFSVPSATGSMLPPVRVQVSPGVMFQSTVEILFSSTTRGVAVSADSPIILTGTDARGCMPHPRTNVVGSAVRGSDSTPLPEVPCHFAVPSVPGPVTSMVQLSPLPFVVLQVIFEVLPAPTMVGLALMVPETHLPEIRKYPALQLKVALTFRAAVIETVQPPRPEQPPPDHPAKDESALGDAVRVTEVPYP